MKACSACGSALGDDDRFCGECGAAVPQGGDDAGAAASAPAQAPPAARPARAGLYAGLALGGLLLFGAGYYVARETGLAPSGTDPGTPAPDAGGTPSDAAPASGEADAATGPADDEPPEAEPMAPIEAGSWTFTTELFDVTRVDGEDPGFEPEWQRIGESETATRCVTPAEARDPAATGFPFTDQRQCRPATLAMRDNRYAGRMTCHFEEYGGRIPIDVEGVYTRTDLSIETRALVPSDVYLRYAITGRRVGSC